MDRARFRHTSSITVRNYEVDWQGVVHNANILLYFEVGRIAYLKDIGVRVDLDSIVGESRVVIARNEIDYRSAARFGDALDVLTRVSLIRNTSFAFEGILEESGSHRVVAENVSVHVWLDAVTGRPKRVPEEFRTSVRSFEGNSVKAG